MLDILYNIRCSITFEHAFYSDDICTDIRILPTETTRQTLDEYGLLIKNTKGKTHIFQQVTAGVPEIPFTDPVCFSFFACLINSDIFNLFDTGAIRQFHLTNLNSDGTFRDTLTQNAFLGASEALPKLMPQRFNFNLKKGETAQLIIEYFDTSSWTIISDDEIDPTAEGYEINLKKSGKYKITKQPLPPGETSLFLIADNDAQQSTPFFALIHIWLDNTIAFGTQYTVKIPVRFFKFQYIFTDIENKQIAYDIPIAVEGTRHILDTITAGNDIAFTGLDIPDVPVSALDTVVANLRKISSNEIFVVESVSSLPVLENRPPSIKLKAGVNNVMLPVPLLNDLQIIDNKAVMFFNI